MFVDRVRIKVTAGAGGNGCCSFRREKYVPKGGPDGGDGGEGGSVYIVADSHHSSLNDLRFHSNWKGKRGVHGRGSDQHGKNAEDVIIHVPPGTVIRDWKTEEIVCDLAEEGQRYCACAGGRGGKGNARFASSTNRAPRFAEKGEPGEEAEFKLELKLIADVGIVGLPNAGKSTLLSRITAANPKIADYPFTTLSPNLGVAQLSDYRSLVVADIPGIIEGAASGRGLGHDFLRHIERTKVLLFLVDAGDDDPLNTLKILENELNQHSPVFETRPREIALNKSDITENRDRYEKFSVDLKGSFFISAATGEGIDELLDALWKTLDDLRRAERDREEAVQGEQEVEYTYEAPYSVAQTDHGYRVEGKQVLRAVRMTDFKNEEAVQHLQDKLKKMGLFRALKRLGAHEGESVLIGDVEMEFHSE